MPVPNGPWRVKETPMYPNSFKVFPLNTYQETNDLWLWKATRGQAEELAEWLNTRHCEQFREDKSIEPDELR